MRNFLLQKTEKAKQKETSQNSKNGKREREERNNFGAIESTRRKARHLNLRKEKSEIKTMIHIF